MKNIIEIDGLTKIFTPSKLFWRRGESTRALSRVSFNVKKGECLALLGPNGAGKTTLIKIFSTLILPDEGNISIGGYNLRDHEIAIKSMIGVVADEGRSFYWRLTGAQNLNFFSSLYGIHQKEARERIKKLFPVELRENMLIDIINNLLK